MNTGIVTQNDNWLSGCKQKVMINDTASGRCVCVEVTANKIPLGKGWSCHRASPVLFNIFANDPEKEGEMHSIYFIWFSRKEARLSPAPGRPLISKACYPPVCRETDCSEAAQASIWESARWWRWWQQYKGICSNYLPGEGAVQEQSSSWRKQNAAKQINKSLCVEGRGRFSINLQGFLLQIILSICDISARDFLSFPSIVSGFIQLAEIWVKRKRWDGIHYLNTEVLHDKGGGKE